jgi:hypothetical protein
MENYLEKTTNRESKLSNLYRKLQDRVMDICETADFFNTENVLSLTEDEILYNLDSLDSFNDNPELRDRILQQLQFLKNFSSLSQEEQKANLEKTLNIRFSDDDSYCITPKGIVVYLNEKNYSKITAEDIDKISSLGLFSQNNSLPGDSMGLIIINNGGDVGGYKTEESKKRTVLHEQSHYIYNLMFKESEKIYIEEIESFLSQERTNEEIMVLLNSLQINAIDEAKDELAAYFIEDNLENKDLSSFGVHKHVWQLETVMNKLRAISHLDPSKEEVLDHIDKNYQLTLGIIKRNISIAKTVLEICKNSNLDVEEIVYLIYTTPGLKFHRVLSYLQYNYKEYHNGQFFIDEKGVLEKFADTVHSKPAKVTFEWWQKMNSSREEILLDMPKGSGAILLETLSRWLDTESLEVWNHELMFMIESYLCLHLLTEHERVIFHKKITELIKYFKNKNNLELEELAEKLLTIVELK